MALPTRQIELVRPSNQELDRALIESYFRGDQSAFTKLVHKYQNALLSFVYHMIGDVEAAEDIVQMTFLRVYRHLGKFDLDRKFTTWIYKIASNLAKNELRNRDRRPHMTLSQLSMRSARDEDSDDYDFPDSSKNPGVLFHKRELARLVRETVTQLTPEHRQVFVLREIEGRSYEEIAEISGANLGTVKSRLNRARAAFAAHIAPYIS